MQNTTIIIVILSSLFLLAIIILLAAKIIRRKRKRTTTPQHEPNIFEKITLQFSDKISKELEKAEKKIRHAVGAEEKDIKDREHGMFL